MFLLIVELLLDLFLLLTCSVLAGDSLPSSSAFRGREDKVTGLLDLLEHINSVAFSFKLCLRGCRPQINVLILQ